MFGLSSVQLGAHQTEALDEARAAQTWLASEVDSQHVLGWGSVLGIGWLGKLVWDDIVAAARASGGGQ